MLNLTQMAEFLEKQAALCRALAALGYDIALDGYSAMGELVNLELGFLQAMAARAAVANKAKHAKQEQG